MDRSISYRRLVHRLFDGELTAAELVKTARRDGRELTERAPRTRPVQIDRKMAAAGERV